jgi:RNA polymerase sigma factor (sigma-70 family)
MVTSAHARAPHAAGYSDERLVRECLNGSQEAWAELIGKYKNLIYSIPIKYGLSREDAGEIFQQVCLQIVAALPALREPRSLAAWLIKVTARGSSDFVEQQRRLKWVDLESHEDQIGVVDDGIERLMRGVEQEQIFREALSQLRPRCQELIRMLFFEPQSVPYEDVAKKLGIAKGSIGFIRVRCLKRLRRQLEAQGFL